MCIVFRDKSMSGIFKFPFCGGFSLHLHKMVHMKKKKTSRKLLIFKGLLRETR